MGLQNGVRVFSLLAVPALLALPRAAAADPEIRAPSAAGDDGAPLAVQLDLGAGVGRFTTSGGAIPVEAALLVRRGWLELGATYDQFLSFGWGASSAAAAGGLVWWAPGQPAFLDALLLAGWRFYRGVGEQDFVCGDPGATGSTPFLGLRAGAGLLLLPEARVSPGIGLTGFYSIDLARHETTYSYFEEESGDFFSCSPTRQVTRTAQIGEAAYGAMFRLTFLLHLPRANSR